MKTIFSAILLVLFSHSGALSGHGSSRAALLVGTPRIVNGKDAAIEMFPYQLSLRRSGIHICGASVLSNLWAITAAHCIEGYEHMPRLFTVRMGSRMRSSGGSLSGISRLYSHPSYNTESMHCDVALLKTTPNRLRGDLVAPIRLPELSEPVAVNVEATVSGWGHASSSQSGLSSVLKYTTVKIVDQTECRDDMRHHGVITQAMFCAAARRTDACQGDSGGPIQVNGTKLIGIVSWGVGCADPHYPGVYTRLSYPPIRQWIRLLTRL